MKENADKARALDSAEIHKQLKDAAESMFRLRFQMSMGQMEGLKKYRSLKKERARMLTVLREREIKPEASAPPAAAPKKAQARPVAKKPAAKKAEPKPKPAAAKSKPPAKPKAAKKPAAKTKAEKAPAKKTAKKTSKG